MTVGTNQVEPAIQDVLGLVKLEVEDDEGFDEDAAVRGVHYKEQAALGKHQSSAVTPTA